MKRISRLLVVLAAAITLLVTPTRALAANSPAASDILINNTSNQSKWPSGVSYDASSGTLTLNNASLSSIMVKPTSATRLTINLIGTSRISTDTMNSGYTVLIRHTGGDTTAPYDAQLVFTGSGTLNIVGYQTRNDSDQDLLCGIWSGGQMTFQGNCTVNVNLTMKALQNTTSSTLYGLHTKQGDVVIRNNATLNVTINALTNAQRGAAVYIENSHTFRVYTSKTVTIDTSNVQSYASSTGYSGIFSLSNTPVALTRPAKLIVKSGRPFNGHDSSAGEFSGFTRTILSNPYGVSYTPLLISDSWVNPISNVTYTGSTRKMSVSILDPYTAGGATWLVEGTDFTTSYSGDLVNVGTVTVGIYGIGTYAGSPTITRTYQILPKDVHSSDVTVMRIFDQTYTGSAVTPNPQISYNGMQLVKGTDYTLSYSNNVNVGQATVYVTGRGNYTGSFNMKFEIVEGYTGVPMYRYYNPWSGEHFYSCDFQERNALVDAGWRSEGIGWYAPPSSGTPVYRLYNPWASGGDHHYTTSWSEYQSCIAAGWKGEGVGWYSDDAHSVSVWREYNPYQAAHNHNYTADKAEHQHLLSVGWRDEGVGWYGVNPPTGPVG